MNKHQTSEVYDYTASFQRTLQRFEKLGDSTKADYARSKEKTIHISEPNLEKNAPVLD